MRRCFDVAAAGVCVLSMAVVAHGDALAEFRALVDNRPAVRASLGARSARAIDARRAELTLGMSVTPAASRAASYRVVSFHDPAYDYAKFVRPLGAAIRTETEVVGPAGCPLGPFRRTIVELSLPSPLKPSAEYFVIAQGCNGELVTGGRTAAGFVFQGEGKPNRSPSETPRDSARLAADDAVNHAVLGLRQIEPVGPRLVMLEFGPSFAVEAASRPENYRVQIAGRRVAVARLGRITRVDTYLPVGWPFAAIPRHEMYLELAAPVSEGERIEVEVDAAVTAGVRRAALVFSARACHTRSLHVNQIGYLTDSPVKMAYLGRWMGSFPEPTPRARDAGRPDGGTRDVAQAFWSQLAEGVDPPHKTPSPSLHGPVTSHGPALAFAEPPEFLVCRASDGGEVFRGRTKLVHRSGDLNEGHYKVDHSGENVYTADFSGFAQRGRYFLSVPGVGRSIAFEISDDVYLRAFRAAAYGLFAQRCGIELSPPYGDWRRIACHRGGIVATSQRRDEPHDVKDLPRKVVRRPTPTTPDPKRERLDRDTALAARYPLDGKLTAYGGHHDAGDYNPRSHLDVAQTLMDAYEMAPAKFYDGQLAIPERANGVPDLLDEAHWALRLWIGLQEADGGVHNGTESAGDPNFLQTVEQDPTGDYAYAADAPGSYHFAGALAQAARLWRAIGKPDEARDMLDRALRAYDWAERHPPKVDAPEAYAAQYLCPRAYAAAQLLRTTGQARFHDAFRQSAVWSRNAEAELEVYGHYDQSLAAWAYVNCADGVADARLRDAVRRAIVRRADGFIAQCQTMAYPFIRHPHAPINWGTGAYENYLPAVLWAHRLTGREVYRRWIVHTCDNTLGANPLSLSYIVGLGERTVRAPLHNSRYSHFGEVVLGQQVQGPVQSGEGYRVAETAWPPLRDNFALLHTFVDCHFAIAMDEGTVSSQAKTVAAFGLLLPDRAATTSPQEKSRATPQRREGGE